MKKQIGVVGVDSGQILITDPCYLDSEWKNEDYRNIQRFKVNGEIYECPRDFTRFDQVIEKLGKSMNQLVTEGQAVPLPTPPAHYNFSYNACCKLTTEEPYYGQLRYEKGHQGVGVVSSTGSDGVYPVYADIDQEGRVKRIIIEF